MSDQLVFQPTPDAAATLIAAGESETVEFKARLASERAIVPLIVAFANSAGGIVFVGVGPDGTIVGLTEREAARALSILEKFSSSLLDRPIQSGTLLVSDRLIAYGVVQPSPHHLRPIRTRGPLSDAASGASTAGPDFAAPAAIAAKPHHQHPHLSFRRLRSDLAPRRQARRLVPMTSERIYTVEVRRPTGSTQRHVAVLSGLRAERDEEALAQVAAARYPMFRRLRVGDLVVLHEGRLPIPRTYIRTAQFFEPYDAAGEQELEHQRVVDDLREDLAVQTRRVDLVKIHPEIGEEAEEIGSKVREEVLANGGTKDEAWEAQLHAYEAFLDEAVTDPGSD